MPRLGHNTLPRRRAAIGQARTLVERASALWAQGNFRGAEYCFQLVLRDHPHNEVALNGVGNLAVVAKRYDMAIEYHCRAVKAAPKEPALRNDLANAFILAGKPDNALPHLRKALLFSPRM